MSGRTLGETTKNAVADFTRALRALIAVALLVGLSAGAAASAALLHLAPSIAGHAMMAVAVAAVAAATAVGHARGWTP